MLPVVMEERLTVMRFVTSLLIKTQWSTLLTMKLNLVGQWFLELFARKTIVKFSYNTAVESGGALYSNEQSHLFFQRKVYYKNNRANDGGAINIHQVSVKFSGGSFIRFNNNSVDKSGGAIYLGDSFAVEESDVTFHHNNANQVHFMVKPTTAGSYSTAQVLVLATTLLG